MATKQKWSFDQRYPSTDDLRIKAKRRIPKFAFEYLDGGCNEDINLTKNTADLHDIELMPRYLKAFTAPDLKTEMFGHVYDAPFGVAPVGLQGLMWPKAPEILAAAATAHNIPFILSTVTTAGIETISKITEGKAWYQLYHPAENSLRDDIIERLKSSGYKVLVLLCDVPSFGYRPRDMRNGLAMPPRMTLSNIIQIAGRPRWALNTLMHGQPAFETLRKYMPSDLNMKQLGMFMDRTFSGRMSHDKIAAIRDQWKGKLVLKGVASEEDADSAVRLGLDGIIVSNHGGRQIDAGESSVHSLLRIADKYSAKLKVMMDSGIRSGPDIARALSCGAEFTFLGRSFMYGVAALGNKGGDHTIAMLKTQLYQAMDQIGCERTTDLSSYRIK